MEATQFWRAVRVAVWIAAAIVVVISLLFTATVATLPGCTTCHNSKTFVSQTQVHAHVKVDCVRCHASVGLPHRLTSGYNLIFGQILRVAPANGGPITAIPDRTCLSCHGDVMKSRITGATGLSILHSQCTKGRMCINCHSETAHGTAVRWIETSTMNQCLECHNTDRVRSNCDSCHARKSQEERISSGEWAVTHGPNWRQTHGMGDLKTCAACHVKDYCVRCHGIPLPHEDTFIRSHPQLAQLHAKDCAVCHKQRFCDSCHGIQMPHPASFTPTHSKLVKAQGKTKCMKCHVDDDCNNCHVKHVHPGGAISPPGGTKK